MAQSPAHTQVSRPGTRPHTETRKAGARLGRLAAVLAAAICGLLASAAVSPAAFARLLPPGGQYGPGPVRQVPATTVRVITTGGMAGWQITSIALGAALFAAAAAVLLYRALTARKAASAAIGLTRGQADAPGRPVA
jgi:hypothetical protein